MIRTSHICIWINAAKKTRYLLKIQPVSAHFSKRQLAGLTLENGVVSDLPGHFFTSD